MTNAAFGHTSAWCSQFEALIRFPDVGVSQAAFQHPFGFIGQ
jgi:hypothetical protein